MGPVSEDSSKPPSAGKRLPRWVTIVAVGLASVVGAAVLASFAGVGDSGRREESAPPTVDRGGDETTTSTVSRRSGRETSQSAMPDRQLVAHVLPDPGSLGAGWLELNREPNGPNDPTLPTAPEVSGECGGRRAVQETGAAFALFERRRAADLDEQAFVYGLLFETVDDATAQAALYRSATLEECLLAGLVGFYGEFGLGVDAVWEERALPTLDDGVNGSGRTLLGTTTVGEWTYEARVEVTVLQSGRAVALLLREAFFGSPDPFPIDGVVEDVSRRLAGIR